MSAEERVWCVESALAMIRRLREELPLYETEGLDEAQAELESLRWRLQREVEREAEEER